MMQRIVVRVEGRSGVFGDLEVSGFPLFHGVGGVKGVGFVLQFVPNFSSDSKS